MNPLSFPEHLTFTGFWVLPRARGCGHLWLPWVVWWLLSGVFLWVRVSLSPVLFIACPFLSCECGVVRALMFSVQVLCQVLRGDSSTTGLSFIFLFLSLLRSPVCSIHYCCVNMICALPLTQAPLGRWAFRPALVHGEAFGGWLNTGHQGRGA